MDCGGKWIWLVLALASGTATAQQRVVWHAFGTAGLTRADSVEDIDGYSFLTYGELRNHWSDVSDTRLGLQADATLGANTRAIVQLMVRGKDGYELLPEWAYLRRQLNPQTTLRLGLLRRPLFQHSDYHDVGYSYSWARPPLTVYSDYGVYNKPIKGADIFYQNDYRDMSFFGNAYLGTNKGSVQYITEDDFEEKLGAGLVFGGSMRGLGFRLSHHRSEVSAKSPVVDELAQALRALGEQTLARGVEYRDKKYSFDGLHLEAQFKGIEWSSEFIRLNATDSISVNNKAYSSTFLKRLGNVALYLGIGGQRGKSGTDYASRIFARAEQYATQTDPASQIAAGTLVQLGNGVQQIQRATRSHRRSLTAGLRFDFHDAASLTLELERVENRLTGETGDIASALVHWSF